ncbi:sugar-binding transcriptional regulator [Alteribacter natronophilus]|uniref:sugar-binding transcriptional regulator n=1 Tax=Alteribacter natronophilus TaxID=2583810 RepID=UPI00110E036B|nr:sugar-binding transcriptional regulator [Alteribacter natronophilus]TMW71032.1 sugar-binding transcriptional regulator [Alteribacter natronophilus]
MDAVKLKRIVRAAKMYYQLDYSQQQIAAELGISRPSVSRLLHEAKEHGIVRVEILDPTEDAQKLSGVIRKRYGLSDCIIVSASGRDDTAIKSAIGKKAAAYLRDTVKDGDTIGATWGTTLYEVTKHLTPKHVNGVSVVQLNGGVSHSETNTHAHDILNRLGEAFSTAPHFLPLPAVVDHPLVKEAIVADRHIKRTLDLAEQANLALITVGDRTENSTLVQADYFTDDDLNVLQENGAVGDICSTFIDSAGNVCNKELAARTIGIELSRLQKKERTVLIAGGLNKVEGILGALKGGYANVLITDQFTAESMVEHDAGKE